VTQGGDLPDRGPGAPVRPGGGGLGPLVFAAVLIVGGAVAYIVTQSDSQWYGSPVEPSPPERVVAQDGSAVAAAPAVGGGTRLQPAGSPQNWVTDDDYPPEALRRGWQGTVAFRLDIDQRGRPSACHVTGTSGTPMLDEAACDLLMQRARFVPARDAQGKTVSASFSSRFTWRIPE